MDILEQLPAHPSPRSPSSRDRSQTDRREDPLFALCIDLGAGSEHTDLLLEAALHRSINQRLYHSLFRGDIAPSSNDLPINAADLEEIFDAVIQEKGDASCMSMQCLSHVVCIESWKVAQRWRAVTAEAVANMTAPTVWTKSIDRMAASIADIIACVHDISYDRIAAHINFARANLDKLWQEAVSLATSIRCDYLSDRLSIVCIPPYKERFNPDWMALKYDMPSEENDGVIGTFAFGLRKVNERGDKTHILQPRVVTKALLRYASDQD
jgi:hypothetical protein